MDGNRTARRPSVVSQERSSAGLLAGCSVGLPAHAHFIRRDALSSLLPYTLASSRSTINPSVFHFRTRNRLVLFWNRFRLRMGNSSHLPSYIKICSMPCNNQLNPRPPPPCPALLVCWPRLPRPRNPLMLPATGLYRRDGDPLLHGTMMIWPMTWQPSATKAH